jgi:ATP-dependent Clp protease protease subunit
VARVIARETGQPLEKVVDDMERDYWMNAQEAIEYGIVSRIIERHQDLS